MATVEFQNEVDAASLYQLLENQIIPLYYAKPDGKLPARLAAVDARIDPQRHARLQHASDGEGIHRAPLPPRRQGSRTNLRATAAAPRLT